MYNCYPDNTIYSIYTCGCCCGNYIDNLLFP